MKFLSKFCIAGLLMLGLLAKPSLASSCFQYSNYAQLGGSNINTQGFLSLTKAQRSFPKASIDIYNPGTTTHISLFSDSACSVSLGNPVTAGDDASFSFWTNVAPFDIKFSGPGITTACGLAGQLPCILPFTWTQQPVGSTSSSSTSNISAKATGALGDGKSVADGVISGTTLTSPTAAFTAADTGKLILILGAGNATHTSDYATTLTYVSPTQITLGGAPPNALNPSTFIWGTNDRTNLNSAIATVTGLQFKPTNGGYIGTQQTIEFPYGIYLIDGPLVTGAAYINFLSTSGAIIVQTSASSDILQFTAGYRNRVQGLNFYGGNRAISYRNSNTDGTKLTLTDSVVQGSAVGLYLVASTSGTGTNLPYSTGTISVTKGSNVVTGSGTSWSDANHAFKELHIVGSDSYYKIAQVGSTTSITLSRPISQTSASGLTYEIGDYHESEQVEVSRTFFINVGQVLYQNTEQVDFTDNWVELWGDTTSTNPYPQFQPHTAAFRTMYGQLNITRMVGVPVMGIAGVGLIRAPRWIDSDGGNVLATQSRFGGEDAGMMLVKSFCPYHDVYPYQGCRFIFVDNWQAYGGQAAANAADVGVLGFYANGLASAGRENVPTQVIFQRNTGLGSVPLVNNEAMTDAGNTVENSSSLDTTTFFGAIPTNVEKKFRWSFSPNETDTGVIWPDGTWNGATRASGFNRFIGLPTVLSVSITSPSLASSPACGLVAVTVNGARNGDVPIIGLPTAMGNLGYSITSWVSANDTVSILFCNATGAGITGVTGNATIVLQKANWIRD